MSRSNDIANITTSVLDGVTKAEVGLGNVDNTSDANKPVSTAQQSAIDGLAYQSVPHIIPDVLYPAVSGNDLSGTALGGSYVYGTAHTDGRKYYYTDIKGSKPIKDPRIGGHFGSQRHKFKSLQLLEQETATHGNDVFSIDGREWCRLVNTGSVKFEVENSDAGNGLNVTSHTFTAFFEITGYFNDFNCISWTKSDRADDINITVNGGTTRNSANTDLLAGKATAQTPLNGRYVDAGSVINHGDSDVASDLGTTPSINTIKIEAINTGSEYWRFYGIELIAQDTSNRNNIQIPSQNVVSYGKKFTVSAEGSSGHHYNPFNGYTATTSFSSVVDVDTSLGLEAWKHTDNNYYPPVNGGRIVKWVDSSGTIKTSVTLMPPNATGIGSFSSNPRDPNYGSWSSQYQPTFKNETERQLHEVAKTYYAREFGNGGANHNASYKDASSFDVSGSSHNIAYVMDDGLTSLSGSAVTHHPHGSQNPKMALGPASAAQFIYITFIGTGFSWTDADGTINNTAQNLPYGSHIAKINRSDYSISVDGISIHTVSSGNTFALHQVSFHQPKRPPIPEDACVLADYMLMADFVAVTSLSDGKIHKGVRRNAGSRDHFYDVSGGSFDSNVTLNLTYSREFGLWANQSPASSHTASTSLPFFGTRISNIFENQQESHTLTIDGGSDLSGSCTKLDNSTINTLDAWVSPVQTLGLHNFTHTRITGGRIYNGTDIATPIHTSSHYQSFETPLLHDLVGGDRNMEQTNLVVSPDGKTWDQITRDTSYIGVDGFLIREPQDTNGSSTTLIYTEYRGVYYMSDQFNKNFAIAYDRMICLKDGLYEVSTVGIDNIAGATQIKINGSDIISGHYTSQSWSNNYIGIIVNMKRGDYIQPTGTHSEHFNYSRFQCIKIK